MKCTKCGGHIHSSRQLCRKCSGVTQKPFEKALTKTRGATIDGVWVSGRERSRKAGIADALALLET